MDRLVPLWHSTRSVPSWLNGELQKVFTKRLQENGLTLSAAEIVEALESMKIQHVSGLKKANSHVYTCGNLEVEAATARDESGEKKACLSSATKSSSSAVWNHSMQWRLLRLFAKNFVSNYL